MKCRDFERLINEQIDGREAAPPEVERALESHRSTCPACRSMSLRYQTLLQAIAMLGAPPVAPADFAARFLERWEHTDVRLEDAATPSILKFRPVYRRVAVAAVLLLSVLAGMRAGWPARPAKPGGTPPPARAIDPDALSHALAEATAATWDLARATSAPAARVGLEVIDSAELPETTASLALPVAVGPAAEVLRDVGERVNEGVHPLSGTARHAFGFLLGPAPAPAEAL